MTKNKIKIGLVRETKTPIDNRVVLTPAQCHNLMCEYPNIEIVAQHSDIRAFSDEEYTDAGVVIQESMDDCDYLFGVKEVDINALLPNKHYVFFGHIAKEQKYNQNLCRSMLNKHITFTDWEYFVDQQGKRVIAFGYWAGVVGTYNALRLYGLRKGIYELPAPDIKSTIVEFVNTLKCIKPVLLKENINIAITGEGRVATGAIELFRLIDINVKKASENVDDWNNGFNVWQLTLDNLVERKDGAKFDSNSFKTNPQEFASRFNRYAPYCDILITGHYWQNDQPVYLTFDMLKDTRIDTIADVTCDINGSIQTTIRPSTHAEPFYGFDKTTLTETFYMEPSAIGVMAVDTCPNALPRDASHGFGEMIIKYLIPEIATGKYSSMIEGATIISNGILTDKFSYLKSYAYDSAN